MGAHGVGKTTLAKAYAEKSGAIFVETSVSPIIRAMGFDPSCSTYDYSTRLTIQEGVLAGVDAIYNCVPPGALAVADRTPIDMLGYTLAEAVGDHVPVYEFERLAKYMERCYEVLNRRFATVMLVQPGIPLQPGRDGKALANLAYIEHLNSLMLGLSVDPRMQINHFYIPRALLTIEERLAAIENATKRTSMYHQQNLNDHLSYGGRVH